MKGGNVFLCKFSLAFSIHSHSYLSFVGRVDDELLPGQMRMSEFENWYRVTCEGRSDKQRRWRRMWRRGAGSGGPGEMGLNTEGLGSSSPDLTETGDVRERPGREENLSEGGGTSDNNCQVAVNINTTTLRLSHPDPGPRWPGWASHCSSGPPGSWPWKYNTRLVGRGWGPTWRWSSRWWHFHWQQWGPLSKTLYYPVNWSSICFISFF